MIYWNSILRDFIKDLEDPKLWVSLVSSAKILLVSNTNEKEL